ncbi:MAG: AmmeMemoRadiSam system radical SAM enzyme [Candidatus Bathyarchaeota archaeon]|nr:AmmeMemoRadiSam system radical SAM enzyme [Candidatus Bathyarchaeota archaeon]
MAAANQKDVFINLDKTRRWLQCPTVREALLYEKLSDNKVRCGLCERRCFILSGQRGFCRTRLNVDGVLYTLVYGDLSALESRPIEIKPFFHYWPGSTALTFSTWSCNFNCAWCQNHNLSKMEPDPLIANRHRAEKVIAFALQGIDAGLCGSFQEPTLLTDWAVPLFKMAREKGLYCCYVSNGYMTIEALHLLKESGMDGLKVDVKGNADIYRKYCGGADVEKVWRNIREARKLGLHVEVVNLVITGVNDDENSVGQLIQRHVKKAGAETPLHFTRYYPAYRHFNPPTKVETLEQAYKMAKKAGVLYPYLGNVPGHTYENTYCPRCEEKLIQRLNNRIVEYKVTKDNRCPKCSQQIPITGKYIPLKQSNSMNF